MNINSSTITPTHAPSSCCATAKKTSPIQKTIDTVCRIAIAVFAAVCAPIPFVVSFAMGILAGSVYTMIKLSQNGLMLAEEDSKPVCAQGYMDFLSGVRFPPAVATLATAAFIAAHTRHDPLFYSPFCGLFVGFWMGRQATEYVKSFHKIPAALL